MTTKKTLAEDLEILVVIEGASLLEKDLGESWGVSAAKRPKEAEVFVNEQEGDDAITKFDILIKDIGSRKIEVIKVIREITNLGLGEALNFVEKKTERKMIAAGVNAALEAKRILMEAGAKVEIHVSSLAGDSTTDAPPPDVKKKKRKGA